MAHSLAELTQDIDRLVSLPGIVARINEAVNDPARSAADIGRIIGQDPALTARLLRVANSAAYGLSKQIETISRAVAVIGTKRIRDLALATSAMNAFEGIPNELVSMDNFWRHSILCAVAAKLLAERAGMQDAESLFVAGLLHDIGQLVIFHKLPGEAKQALLLSVEGPNELALHDAEQRVIGVDHAQVGGALLRHWRFPEKLIECVEFHHAPARAAKFPREAALVHIANSIATLAEINSVAEEDAVHTDEAAWTLAGLGHEVIEPVVRAAQAQFSGSVAGGLR
jgi:putative nucleotidyltransferase with HDIG domain